MPIKPENRARYPKDWKRISGEIRERSGGRCECHGECGLHRTTGGPRRCEEMHGEAAKWAKGKVILTVAHLDHTPENCSPENLKAMCQRCHLRYDIDHHKKTARATREAKSPQMRLTLEKAWPQHSEERTTQTQSQSPAPILPPSQWRSRHRRGGVIEFKTEKAQERFSEINPTLQAICHEMDEFCKRRGKPFVLTETLTTAEEDKALGRVSISHQEGRAVDIRTRDWPEEFRELFIAHFSGIYGSLGAISKDGKRNLLVYHDSGHGAHIHAQLDTRHKKETK